MRGGAKLALPVILQLYENLDSKTQHAFKQQIESTLFVYFHLLAPKVGQLNYVHKHLCIILIRFFLKCNMI